jgi:hypothetical protein
MPRMTAGRNDQEMSAARVLPLMSKFVGEIKIQARQ